MANVKFKECPFCGCDSIIYQKSTNWVYCSKCFAIGPNGLIEKVEAINAWNKRMEEEEIEGKNYKSNT